MPITILLVDDDPIQAATRRAILTHSGNEVVIASGGRKGLSLLDDVEFAQHVGMVITDHLMPGMNGLQFVTELRQRFPTLPILVLSGLPDGEPEYAGLNVLYRLKPLAPEELIQLTQSIPGSALGRTA